MCFAERRDYVVVLCESIKTHGFPLFFNIDFLGMCVLAADFKCPLILILSFLLKKKVSDEVVLILNRFTGPCLTEKKCGCD